MVNFVTTVAATGCRRFTIHARKAWLKGLSPKDNRNIPPLRYDDVYRLKQENPNLWIEINGGVKTLEAASEHFQHVDAVMIGRAAYDTPYIFALADHNFYAADKGLTRHQVVLAMLPYIARWTDQGTKLHSITRHMLQLFHGQPGSRAWKRHLTDNSCRPGAGVDTVKAALDQVLEAMSKNTYADVPLSM
jgi:tRNA-dihydrouridine synthase A